MRAQIFLHLKPVDALGQHPKDKQVGPEAPWEFTSSILPRTYNIEALKLMHVPINSYTENLKKKNSLDTVGMIKYAGIL